MNEASAPVLSAPPGAADHATSGLPNEADALALLRALQQREAYRPPRPATGPVLLYGAGQLGQMALAWGSTLVDAGDVGHLDIASGHGPWPEGAMRFGLFLKHLG